MRASIALLILLSLISLSTAACIQRPLLRGGALSQNQITPNGDRVGDYAELAYVLARPAIVTLQLRDDTQHIYFLRREERRPQGSYVTTIDGTYDTGQRPVIRRILPDGTYTWVLTAKDDGGDGISLEGKLEINGGDQVVPSIENLAAFPPEISPFDPDFQDETRITYRLTKEATVSLYVVGPDGGRTLIAAPTRRPPGEYAEAWNGYVRNRLLPAGTHTYIAEAKDSSGNVAEAQGQVALRGTEQPDAIITKVEFEPKRVIYGDTVAVKITVLNTGKSILKSHGPLPGFTYTTKDTFASVANGQYVDKHNYWRVGIDWAGGLGPEGSRYPYRWGFGKDLAPGEEVTVVGYIRILERFPQIWLYAGLVHEGISYHVNRVGQTLIDISY